MKKLTWKNEKRKLADLTPFEGNPRKATEKDIEDLDRSLERFDIAEPLVINTTGEVIGGNFRLSRLKEKGVEVVDVRVPNRQLNRKEAEELNLRLNKNQGRWDFDVLANFGEDLLKDVGFESDELDEIFGLDMADEFNEEKEFEKAVKNPRGVKAGDIWQLGEHRLIIGDATVRDNWERVLDGEKFDLMETDPPYRLAYCKKRVRKVKTKEGWKVKREREYNSVGETDKEGKVKGFGAKGNGTYQGVEMAGGVPEFDEWLSLANEFQNPKGANVMVFENWKNIHDLWEAIEKYWKIKNLIIWHLPNRRQGFSARHQFFGKYDVAPLADKGEAVFNQEEENELKDYLKEKGQKLFDSYEIIFYAKSGKSEWNRKSRNFKGAKWMEVTDHITWHASSEASTGQNLVFGTKPIQILVPYIKILSSRNGIVMEPFGGSGSTIIASHIMKRKCRAIELSPTYGEVILNRFQKFSGIEPVKVDK